MEMWIFKRVQLLGISEPARAEFCRLWLCLGMALKQLQDMQHLPVMQVFSVHCKYKASKQHNKDSLKPILKLGKNYLPYLSREIILNSILYWGVNEWCKQMSSQQTLQWFAHWLVALCFWLLMRNLWELKKRGHGFSKRSPLLKRTLCGIGRSVPLVACDMVFWNGKVGYFRWGMENGIRWRSCNLAVEQHILLHRCLGA